MEKIIKQIRILLCLALLCFLMGFCISAYSINTIFIGIGVILMGAVLAFIAIIPVSKLIQMQSDQKDGRIKKLEEEIKTLKKK